MKVEVRGHSDAEWYRAEIRVEHMGNPLLRDRYLYEHKYGRRVDERRPLHFREVRENGLWHTLMSCKDDENLYGNDEWVEPQHLTAELEKAVKDAWSVERKHYVRLWEKKFGLPEAARRRL